MAKDTLVIKIIIISSSIIIIVIIIIIIFLWYIDISQWKNE